MLETVCDHVCCVTLSLSVCVCAFLGVFYCICWFARQLLLMLTSLSKHTDTATPPLSFSSSFPPVHSARFSLLSHACCVTDASCVERAAEGPAHEVIGRLALLQTCLLDGEHMANTQTFLLLLIVVQLDRFIVLTDMSS